ncbi:MAG: hypothetical protein D3906_09800, partial [Candidatus Electrothrix sp. AUS1_2]|nr:hypothetical protein [Candidatus Electrothrix sp. AUS1_2]
MENEPGVSISASRFIIKTAVDMLDSFVNERTRMYIEKSFKKPSFIPTGVYIESMNFRSTTEI